MKKLRSVVMKVLEKDLESFNMAISFSNQVRHDIFRKYFKIKNLRLSTGSHNRELELL